MKNKLILTTAIAVGFSASAYAQTFLNVTGATAFRKATIDAIIAGYGGAANVGILHSNAAATVASAEGANAISFSGTYAGVTGTTVIRCRFSGSTEGIRDMTGAGSGTPNDVFYYPDGSIPAVGTISFLNQNGNPTGANVAQKPDISFSDVQQNSSPYRTPVLLPADSRVGVVTFVFAKSQGSSANLTNVTDQAWGAVLRNQRGVPLSVFTGISGDSTGRVLATGRNDGSGTRAEYLIETGYGVSRLVNQFKIAANTFNGITSAGFTGDVINALQLWPSNDAELVDNNSVLWNPLTVGNGGYFSSGNVSTLLQKDTSSVSVYGPTGTILSSSGSYVATGTTATPVPRAFSVVASIGTNDAVNVIAGGGAVLTYNGVGITPVAAGVDATGLVPADRFKVTNGQYTHWSYERLFNRGTLSTDQNTIVYGATTGIANEIPNNLGNTGIALTAMVATRANDGEVVVVP